MVVACWVEGRAVSIEVVAMFSTVVIWALGWRLVS
jgi:hypothetical protein